MILKLISSGQAGVEQAALDVAIKLGLSHGGWTPRGRCNRHGPLNAPYSLKESTAVGYQKALEQNVMDADGTLIVTKGQKSPQINDAVKMALKHQKQMLHVDLSQKSAFESASLVNSWFEMNTMRSVFVTGITDSDDSAIYGQAMKILETAFYLGFVKSGPHNGQVSLPMESVTTSGEAYPKTVMEAVERLKSVLPLKDLSVMANMQMDELDHLQFGLGEYIKQHFGLYTGNKPLLESSAQKGGLVKPIPDEACAVILRALWEDLQSTYKLRRVK